jgi:hypothetical protein
MLHGMLELERALTPTGSEQVLGIELGLRCVLSSHRLITSCSIVQYTSNHMLIWH